MTLHKGSAGEVREPIGGCSVSKPTAILKHITDPKGVGVIPTQIHEWTLGIGVVCFNMVME